MVLSLGAAGLGGGDRADADPLMPRFEESLGADEDTVGVADLEMEVRRYSVSGAASCHYQLTGGHRDPDFDVGGELVAVAVGVPVVVVAGDREAPSAGTGGVITGAGNPGDGAGVGGVDGGTFSNGEVRGRIVMMCTVDLNKGDRVGGKGERVQAVGGDHTAAEPEGPVVVDPTGDPFHVFARVVVAA